ncbi:hypothetical protein FXO38_05335 [Capsicum annuum]|nr:hypothetical protein FXO38_05335 [Capsicum annuum]
MKKRDVQCRFSLSCVFVISFSIYKAIENGGGRWQGQGWLGNGKWTVSRAIVGYNGCCKCCAKKLVTIDLDPKETENIAKSIGSQAAWRERNSIVQKFQCLHEAGRYHKVALLDLYLEALDPELYNSRLSNHDCDNAKDKSLLSDNDKLFKLQKAKMLYCISIEVRFREEEFAELSNNNDNVPGIIPQVGFREGRVYAYLTPILTEFLDLGEVVGTKSGGLDYIFAL